MCLGSELPLTQHCPFVCLQTSAKVQTPTYAHLEQRTIGQNNYLQPQVIINTCIASLATSDNNLTGSHAIRHHLRHARQLNPCNITER